MVDAYKALSDVEPAVLTEIAVFAEDKDIMVLKVFLRDGQDPSSEDDNEVEGEDDSWVLCVRRHFGQDNSCL